MSGLFFILALFGVYIVLDLYLGYKGIDPEVIGRKAFRKDNPADKEESDQQESNPK
jgi:hypothetical protein